MTEYDKPTHGEIVGKPIPKEFWYKSVLQREVPYCNINASDPRFDSDLCWWCQDNPRIRGEPDVIIWCQRCYKLHYKKHDGTYIKSYTQPIGKDLQEIQAGKVKILKVDEPSNKVIIED